MKTPSWGYTVGILLMLFGGCSGMKNMQYVATPALIENQKKMFKAMSEDVQSDKKGTLNTDKGDSITGSINKHNRPLFPRNMSNTMQDMLNISDYQKTWIVRLGYIGFVPTLIYMLAGVFLLIRRKFSIKLAYGALILSILFSIVRVIALSQGSPSSSFVTMSLGVGQMFGIIIDIILIVIIAASDKTAYLPENLENNIATRPNGETTS